MTRTPARLTITPNRMFAAADMLLTAINSPRGFDSQITTYIGPLPTGRSLPPMMFTPDELVEALRALARMGFVRAIAPNAGAGPPL